MPQQVGLVLLGIVRERRATDRAGSADHGRHAAPDLRIRDHRLEDVGCALRIADQHEARRARIVLHGHDRVADLARVGLGTRQRIDLEDDCVIPELAHMRRGGAGRLQPLFEAFVPDAGHHRRHEAPFRRAEIDGLAGAGGFCTDAGQCFVAGPVVRKRATVRLQHGAVDLAEARPLVLHARLGSRRENERRRVGRVRYERLRRACAEREACHDDHRANNAALRRIDPAGGRHATVACASMTHSLSRIVALLARGSLASLQVRHPVEKLDVGKAERPRSEEEDRAQAVGMVARAVECAFGAASRRPRRHR